MGRGKIKLLQLLYLHPSKETVHRKSEENSRCWRFLADRIIIFDCAKEADRVTVWRQTWFFTSHLQNSSLKFVSEMKSINNFYILSLWNLFETEIVANGAILPFKNLLSINKFWENGEVFLNFSTFCWSSDFLCIVSLLSTSAAGKQKTT